MQKTNTFWNKIYPYLISVGLVLIMTLLGEFVKRKLEPTNIVMFYLLAVVIVAIRWGLGLASFVKNALNSAVIRIKPGLPWRHAE
jgi:K+-sensing histidine kinase KdpD